MNVYDIVDIAKKRPGIYFGNSKKNLLIKMGFFINGFLCNELLGEEMDSFDCFFNSFFCDFIKKKTHTELTEFKFWFEIIIELNSDEEKALVMFLECFDEFYDIYLNRSIKDSKI